MSVSTEWERYFDGLQAAKLKRIIESADKDSFNLGGLDYKYKKITVKQFMELEQMRADMQNEKDKTRITGHFISIYKKSAEYFFGMDEATFWTIPFEEIKPALDACTYRSLNGKPFLST